jgi:hypothetical protein
MTVVLAAVAVLLVGCGGGGDDSGPAQTSDSRSVDLVDVICEGLAFFFGGECVGIEPIEPIEPIDNRPLAFELVFSPQLSIREQVLQEVTIDWLPPEESWEGLSSPFISGYVIRLSKWDGNAGVFFGVDTITLNDPAVLTYVVEIPEPGRYLIYMTAVSSYTGREGPSSGYVEVNFQPAAKPLAPVLAVPLDPMPGSQVVTLDWIPPSQNDNGTPLTDLAGYNVYFGPAPGMYLDFRHLDNPGLVTYVLDLPSSGFWFIVITALDSAGNESDFSNEVGLLSEPLPPPGMP